MGSETCAPLSRFTIRAHAEPLPTVPLVLPAGLYLLTPDDLGVADAISRKLRGAGVQPMLVPEELLDDVERLAHWLDAQCAARPSGLCCTCCRWDDRRWWMMRR